MSEPIRFCRAVPGRHQCDTCTGRLHPGEQPAVRHSRHEPWPFEPCPHYCAPADKPQPQEAA